MLRVLRLAAIICVCGILCASTAESRTVNSSPTRATTTATASSSSHPTSTTVADDERYHPAEVTKPRVLEERNQRYSDGNYEYRYVLSNGVTRYEKSYWTPTAKGEQVLARKGFYSHPLSNNKYLTVFYTADDTGFHQDSLKYTERMPVLPKHLEVPEHEFPLVTTKPTRATTTRKPTTTTTTTTTTRRPRTTITTTFKPWTTTRKPVVKPSKFNWIY